MRVHNTEHYNCVVLSEHGDEVLQFNSLEKDMLLHQTQTVRGKGPRAIATA